MFGCMNLFYQFPTKGQTVVNLYFDDLMFYVRESNGHYSRDCYEYKYRFFLKFYLNFTDSMMRLFESGHAESISRRIRTHMKEQGISQMPLYEVVEFLEKDTIIYIFKNGLDSIIARPYPEVLFERAYSNPNKDTFDHITISFSIVHGGRDRSVLIEWIKRNKKHMHFLITSSIRPKLENKYGISINYLKVDDCILTRDYRLVYKLSLKNLNI